MSRWLLCSFCVLLIHGCGDSGADRSGSGQAEQVDLTEAERKLEEAQRLLEQTRSELEQAKIEQFRETEVPGYVVPPDRIEPFYKVFGFGNQDEVDHFWHRNQAWQFTPDYARNDKWKSGSVFAFNYQLDGDFQVGIKAYMSRSYTNSRKPKLQICGQEILLKKNTGKGGLDIQIERVGNQLHYTLAPDEPVVMDLTQEQSGPTGVTLVFYNRHFTIHEFSLSADQADRIVQ